MSTNTGIQKDVIIIPDIKTVGELYNLAKQKQIQVMPEWLQRLMQPKKWQASKGKKTKSFLSSFFKGSSLLTPFYWIQIDVLGEFINEEIELSEDKVREKIYLEIAAKINEYKSAGVKYILLDKDL